MLAGAGLQGVEVYYKKHDDADIARYAKAAERLELVACGGSDFHGNKDDEQLPGDLPLPPEAAAAFVAFLERAWAGHAAGVP